MKSRKTLCVAMIAMALLVAAGAAAKPKDSGSAVLHSDAVVGSSHLASGTYDVQWQTHSPEATVSFLRRGKVVATAEGKIEDRGKKYPANEVLYGQTAGDAHAILEIRFKGSSQVIVFNQ